MCPLTGNLSWPRPPGKIHRLCRGQRRCSDFWWMRTSLGQVGASSRCLLGYRPLVGTLTKPETHALPVTISFSTLSSQFPLNVSQQPPKTAKSMSPFLSVSFCICISTLFFLHGLSLLRIVVQWLRAWKRFVNVTIRTTDVISTGTQCPRIYGTYL